MKKLRAANTNFLFACLVCSVKVSSGKIQKQMKKSAEIESTFQNEVHQIRMAYENERTKMIKELEERDKALTKATREIELTKLGEQSTPRGSGKRLRADEQSFEGFPQPIIVEETITKMLEPVLKMFAEMSKRQDELTASIRELTASSQKAVKTVTETITENVKKPTLPVAQTSAPPSKKKLVMSYAEALAKSSFTPSHIRNINLNGTPEEIEKVSQLLRKDNLFAEMNLKSIKPKGKVNYTFKCADPKMAAQVTEKLTEKYGKVLQVKSIQPTLPQLKITKLYSDSPHSEEILVQIIEQNPWLKDIQIKVEQFYVTTTSKGETYKNLIISTDLKSHKILLKRGSIVFGFAESKIYEYINLLQCNRCLRYGHFARDCTFQASCKKCTLNHNTRECTAEGPMKNIKCVNCISANTRGALYSTRHRPTDERCQSRLERIDELKKLHISKN